MSRLRRILAEIVLLALIQAHSFAADTNQPTTTRSSWEKDEPLQLTFSILGSWQYREGKTPVPDYIQKFNDKKVLIRGFMLGLGEVKEVSQFVLIPSLYGCCFGQPLDVNHVLAVKLTRDRKTRFIPDVVEVRGTFHVGEVREDDQVISLYRVDADEVKAR